MVNWGWRDDLDSWCSSGISERCAARWVPLSLCFPFCKTWMVLPASQDPWEFHGLMTGEFWGQRKSPNVVLSSPHLSPLSAFSPRTSPLLSCLGLTLSYWSIQTTVTQSSQLYFRPHLFSWVPLRSWSWSWWVLMVTFVFICGPRTGARVGCLWLTARLKTGSKLAVRRWSFAPEIHYRFKPTLKMHLQVYEPEWKAWASWWETHFA